MLLSLGHALALIPSNGLRDWRRRRRSGCGGLGGGLAVVWALDLEPVLGGALTW